MAFKPKILIVEDDEFYRSLAMSVLSGNNVIIAKRGEEAISKFRTEMPDIVFLDIELPDKKGHEVLQEIMKINPGAFVVMVSGNHDEASVKRAVNNGAKGYVIKPYSKASLEKYIRVYSKGWQT